MSDQYQYSDDFLMKLACLVSKRSKDPKFQVGACIVNKTKQQIGGFGYNGFPNGCSNDVYSWSSEDKQQYVCHAELNAICNSNNREDFKDSTLVVTRFPCNECAKLIIQVGLKKVIYMSEKKKDEKEGLASQSMFEAAGVTWGRFIPDHYQLKIDFQNSEVEYLDPVGDKTQIDKKKIVQPIPRNENLTLKRKDVMEFDEYVMAVTLLIATNSEDKTGACIGRVNSEQTFERIIGVGHKRGIIPDGFTVDHAVTHAIFNRKLMEVRLGTGDVSDFTYIMYSVKFPCDECARAIVQSGIKKVFHMNDDGKTPEAEETLRKGGVTCRKFVPLHHEILYDIVME